MVKRLRWLAIGPNLTGRFNTMDRIKLPGANIDAIELNTNTTATPSSTLTTFIDNNKPTMKLDELSKLHNETIIAFDTGYEHHAALTTTNQLLFGGVNHRHQSFAPIQSVRHFCCTGWATAWITDEGQFDLVGFDFDQVEPLKQFCQSHQIRFMAGGAHHIIIVSVDNVVLIVTNRPVRLIQFKTTLDISAIASSLYDCFIRLSY